MPEAGLPDDVWRAGAAYEPYVGRWSARVATEFLAWLAVPPGARWLDVGCGTGALAAAILAAAAPGRLVGVDPSEGFLAYAANRLRDGRVELRVGDARALPVDDSGFDVAVAGLVLNFVLEPARALAEMRRAVRPGGSVAVYVWDYAEGMQLMRRFWDAAAALDPAAAGLDEGLRFPLCRPGPLRALFEEAGLEDVEIRAIEIATPFRDFDDFWSPFMGGQGPAPSCCMSLSEPARAALRDRLEATLPAAADGRIDLRARAFAVRGRA